MLSSILIETWGATMNVNLGAMFDQFVSELIKSGQYQSQSEVIREGLRLLKEREELRVARLAHLRSEIDEGLKDLENGAFETHDADSLNKLSQQVKARGRHKLSAKTKAA